MQIAEKILSNINFEGLTVKGVFKDDIAPLKAELNELRQLKSEIEELRIEIEELKKIR